MRVQFAESGKKKKNGSVFAVYILYVDGRKTKWGAFFIGVIFSTISCLISLWFSFSKGNYCRFKLLTFFSLSEDEIRLQRLANIIYIRITVERGKGGFNDLNGI